MNARLRWQKGKRLPANIGICEAERFIAPLFLMGEYPRRRRGRLGFEGMIARVGIGGFF